MTLIKVTRKDIQLGRRRDCYHCPIALAITRVLRPKYKVDVKNSGALIRSSIPGEEYRMFFQELAFDEKVASFINWFDSSDRIYPELEPFEFELNINREYLK